MKRIEVWVDCSDDKEEETRRKLKAALNSIGIPYTLMYGSYEVVKEGSQK